MFVKLIERLYKQQDVSNILILSINLLFVFIRFWPSILDGYFRYDDFEFFSDNRSNSLMESINMLHGDHALPLYRYQVAFMKYIFGVNVVYYNVVTLLVFVVILNFTWMLFRKLKYSDASFLLFSVLFLGWSNWGEMTTGYFCLIPYLQVSLCLLISIWSCLQWQELKSLKYQLLAILFLLLAVFVDISGIWVPFAVVSFVVLTRLNSFSKDAIFDFCKEYSWLFVVILAVYFLSGAYNYYLFDYVNPGHFLSMSGKHSHDLLSLPLQIGYLIVGGLVAAFILPLGYSSLPFVSWLSILIILTIVSFIIGCKLFSSLCGGVVKRHTIAVVFMILLSALVVSVGRPMTGVSYFWYSKYTGIPYFWFCVLIGFLWDHFWKRADVGKSRRMFKRTVTLLVASIVLQISSDFFVADVLGLKVTGYVGHLRDSKERNSAVSQLRDKLVEPLAQNYGEMKIPTLDGKFVAAAYPCLFQYNLSHYLDFIVPDGKKVVLYRNKSMQQWTAKDVVTVPSLRSTVDKRFINRLTCDPYLQQLYLSPVELNSRALPISALNQESSASTKIPDWASSTVSQNGRLMVDSDGTAEIMVDSGHWDPERRNTLLLDFSYADRRHQINTQSPLEIDVVFDGELKIPYCRYPVIVQTNNLSNRVSIDLLQLYAFSLNPTVNSLRIRLSTPGLYKFSEAKLI